MGKSIARRDGRNDGRPDFRREVELRRPCLKQKRNDRFAVAGKRPETIREYGMAAQRWYLRGNPFEGWKNACDLRVAVDVHLGCGDRPA